MSTTKIDISFFRGGAAAREDASFVAFNPTVSPGSLVAAASVTTRESISNQVACKLALDHFVGGVLDHVASLSGTAGVAGPRGESGSPAVLEAGFKRANSAVYQFGHKLAAGGRMAAALLGLVVAREGIAVGRAGRAAAYLCRSGAVHPFFDRPRVDGLSPEQVRERLVGAHSRVAVEFAEVASEPGDVIVALAEPLAPADEARLTAVLESLDLGGAHAAAELVERLSSSGTAPAFTLVAAIGPQAIYLDQPAA